MDFSPRCVLTLNLYQSPHHHAGRRLHLPKRDHGRDASEHQPDKSRSRRIKANRFTNREIREALDTPGYLDKKQTTEFATELPRRASFSLACIVFALIGVPLAINTRRKDTSTGFALGILIASLYFLALIFADLSRKNDTMLPYILLWLPNIITVAVALHLHKRARHSGWLPGEARWRGISFHSMGASGNMMCMQHVPTIAIVRQAHVGKSAIFNRR